MSNQVATVQLSEISSMAEAISSSGLFGVQNKTQAMALMLVAQAQGLHPATVAMDYHIIQGRPALKSEALLARFQNAGGCVKWPVYTDSEVVGVFSHPKGGEVEIRWTLEMAENAGLFQTVKGERLQKTKNGLEKGNWQKYPRQLLRSRCCSEGPRTVLPSVTGGMYVVEEVEQFDEPKAPRKPIETEATIVQDKPKGMTKAKETLTEDHPSWPMAVKALTLKTYTIEQIKGKYELSPEIEHLLKTITETTEGEQNESV